MTSPCTALSLLVAWLLGQAYAGRLELTAVSRTDSRTTRSVNLTLDYKASEAPQVRWFGRINSQWYKWNGVVSHEGSAGTTSLVIDNGRFGDLVTWIGDPYSQYFAFSWNLGGRNQRLLHNIELPMSTISPGSVVTHNRNDDIEVNITETIPRGKCVSFSFTGPSILVGAVGSLMNDFSVPGLRKAYTVRMDGNRPEAVSSFKLPSHSFNLNSYFRGSVAASVDDENSPISEKVEECFVVLAHTEDNTGPYLNDIPGNVYIKDTKSVCISSDIAGASELSPSTERAPGSREENIVVVPDVPQSEPLPEEEMGSEEENVAVVHDVLTAPPPTTTTTISPNQPGDAGEKLRIVKVSRTGTEDRTSFNFSVTYWAIAKPDIIWILMKKDYTNTVFNDSGSFVGMEGEGFIVVEKGKFLSVSTWIGNADSHFINIIWRQDENETNFVHEVHIPASNFTPGTNLTYERGQPTVLEIRQRLPRGTGVTFRYDASIIGYVVKPGARQLTYDVAFVDHRYLEDEHVHVSSITFPTDVKPINGYYFYHMKGNMDNPSQSPVSRIVENSVLLVHEVTNQGPFPNDAMFYRFKKLCSLEGNESICILRCSGYTNEPQEHTLQIAKVYGNGTEVPIESNVTKDDFSLFTKIPLREEDIQGNFTCRGLTSSGDFLEGVEQSLEEEHDKMNKKRKKAAKKSKGSTKSVSTGSDGIKNPPPAKHPKPAPKPVPPPPPPPVRPPPPPPPQPPPEPRRRSRGRARRRRRG